MTTIFWPSGTGLEMLRFYDEAVSFVRSRPEIHRGFRGTIQVTWRGEPALDEIIPPPWDQLPYWSVRIDIHEPLAKTPVPV